MPSAAIKYGRTRKGAWIEIMPVVTDKDTILCRTREGAWIEIFHARYLPFWIVVAPVRERGLKCGLQNVGNTSQGRTREGEWMEI